MSYLKNVFQLELIFLLFKETVTQGCSVKKMFLEISQNLQENTSVSVSFLTKLQALGLFLRTPFLTKQLWVTASVFSLGRYCNDSLFFFAIFLKTIDL